MIFSILVFFIPVMIGYALEIRMYSWGCLISFLCGIYAYRYYKNIKEKEQNKKIKNLVLFSVTSICSCYIHYYGILTAGLINLILLIYLIKNRKEVKKDLIQFLVVALVQVLLYVPWLLYLAMQIQHVHGGYWITLDPIKTPIDILSFHFRAFELDNSIYTILGVIIASLLYIYLGIRTYKYKKANEDIKPMKLGFGIYFGVILIAVLVTIVIWRPILTSRYLLIMTGMYIFGLAYMLGKEKNKILLSVVLISIVMLGTFTSVRYINENYDETNLSAYNYIKENIRDDDIFIYTYFGNCGVMSVKFSENTHILICSNGWQREEKAYSAYAPAMKMKFKDENDNFDWNFLKDFKGRIWLVGDTDSWIIDEFPKEKTRVLKDTKKIETKYHNYVYQIKLIEKF